MSRRSLSGWRAKAAIALGVATIALVLASHDRPRSPERVTQHADGEQVDVAEGAQRLAGTWLREQTEQGVRSRRLLQLAPDGAFRERVRIVTDTGEVSEQEHAGTWLYDGTNLKRKYTLMNGSPPSRLKLPFATFEIRFESRNEFVGRDHIHRNTVRYRRVEPGTAL